MAKKKTSSSRSARGKQKKAVVKRKKPAKTQSAKKKAASVSVDMFENLHRTKIRVVGIGGGGGNIVAEVASRVQKMDFMSANTDNQALRELPHKVKTLSFGQDFTHGLGCGMDAELGERAAKAEKEKIKKALEGNDICIFIASLGGGTGSGASPIFAEVAHELRILTIGIFTMPFSFEGDKRTQIAQASLEKLKPFLNTYVVIPNENIFHVIDNKTPLKVALSAVNKKLAGTLEGFIETLSFAGLINIDFADVRSVLEGRGRLGFLNSAEGAGQTKAQDAVKLVLQNPLYDYGISGADRILFNVVGDRNLRMQEVAQVSNTIAEYNPKARIIFGVSCSNTRLKDKLRVTLFAVGCGTVEKEGSGRSEKESGKKTRRGKAKKIPIKRVTQKAENKGEGAKEGEREQEVSGSGTQERRGTRRSAIEVKRAVDEELEEIEKKEKEWDIPAFLRNK